MWKAQECDVTSVKGGRVGLCVDQAGILGSQTGIQIGCGGAGLGLSIAQDIVSRHGGAIECMSQPGDTRFSLYLPVEEPS